jgi:hypothetical protein
VNYSQEERNDLHMTELCDLKTRGRHRNGATSLKSLKEPLLYRIVIEGAINIYWPY